MNFFEEQIRARRETVKLFFLFPLAVLGLCLLLYGFLFLFSIYLEDSGYIYGFQLNFTYLSIIVVGVVATGSLYKIQQLKNGGKVVAEALGGSLLSPETRVPEEQKLLNIVKEMSIASGTPVPSVYILEELSINAFAAGLTPQNAVIGVTRAAITHLSRDELQGVIAHEFSHILYGDMRLNTYLVGILHGILIIALLGQRMLLLGENPPVSSQENIAENKKPKNKVRPPITLMLFGFILLICGYIGVFFANLIKNAVNHQREFLADASAVQFTRNPSGIAGALEKIRALKQHKTLTASRTAEFSHMYFTQGISQFLSGYEGTHPPLIERISRIKSGWNQKFSHAGEVAPAKNRSMNASFGFIGTGFSGANGSSQSSIHYYPTISTEQALECIGAPKEQHLNAANVMLQSLPVPLKKATYTPKMAQILVYLFLLHPKKDQRDKQLRQLQTKLPPEDLSALHHLHQLVPIFDTTFRLPLLSLAIPSLKECSAEQIQNFMKNLQLLATADQRVNLMEWSLIRILKSALQQAVSIKNQYQLAELSEEIALILSTLAYVGQQNDVQVQQAFSHAHSVLSSELKQELTLTKMDNLKSVNHALDRLRALSPLQKPLLLKAMAQCVSYDDCISVTEAELLRAIANSLDCPMPTLLHPVMARSVLSS